MQAVVLMLGFTLGPKGSLRTLSSHEVSDAILQRGQLLSVAAL
jgi:hypothetical protein